MYYFIFTFLIKNYIIYTIIKFMKLYKNYIYIYFIFIIVCACVGPNIFILIVWANFILHLYTKQISNIVTENSFRRHEY